LLNEFIAYLILRFGNPESQNIFCKILMGEAERSNPNASIAELRELVTNRLSVSGDLEQSQQVLGPLISSIESLP
jgi:hypothetical protein